MNKQRKLRKSTQKPMRKLEPAASLYFKELAFTDNKLLHVPGRQTLVKGSCCLRECGVQGWPRRLPFVLLSTAVLHIARLTGFFSESCREIASPIDLLACKQSIFGLGSRYVCTGDFRQKMAHTIQCFPCLLFLYTASAP